MNECMNVSCANLSDEISIDVSEEILLEISSELKESSVIAPIDENVIVIDDMIILQVSTSTANTSSDSVTDVNVTLSTDNLKEIEEVHQDMIISQNNTINISSDDSSENMNVSHDIGANKENVTPSTAFADCYTMPVEFLPKKKQNQMSANGKRKKPSAVPMDKW